MNKQLRTALLTTLIQLPIILWQHMFIGMYLFDTRRVDFSQPINIMILIFMIVLTFIVALKTERINKTKWQVYNLILLSLIVAIVFDSSWMAQIGLFLVYIGLMIYPFDQKKEVVSVKDIRESISKSIEEEGQMRESNINSFEDLLKRGNLPDDDREVPNWLKIKNRQFDDVDIYNNTVDEIVALSN